MDPLLVPAVSMCRSHHPALTVRRCRRTAATVDAARAEALDGLCELSVSILRNAGLASSLVRSS